MKKKDKTKEDLIRNRREKKLLSRRRKNKQFNDPFSYVSRNNRFLFRHDSRIIELSKFELDDFLDSNRGIKPILTNKIIYIPKVFILEKNFEACIDAIGIIRATIKKHLGAEIKISFENCKEIDYGALFLLKVIVDEYLEYFISLQRRLKATSVIPQIRIAISKRSEEVNNMLVASQIIIKPRDNSTKFLPISSFNFIKGYRAKTESYRSNEKVVAAIDIRKYINHSLNRQNLKLDESSCSYLDGIITEILNNAEDHSVFDTWYAAGNFFETTLGDSRGIVGEVNLAFMNFGYSIFRGFEDSKIENHEIYNQMQSLFDEVHTKCSQTILEKEQFFTLYALQDGFSRLRYIDRSRGTGTMKFLNSFLDLGDFQVESDNIVPNLFIYSGNTMIKCDHEFRPFNDNGVNYLSLNKEQDMTLPPQESHLKQTPLNFPGTLLVVKVYLNEYHLLNKNA